MNRGRDAAYAGNGVEASAFWQRYVTQEDMYEESKQPQQNTATGHVQPVERRQQPLRCANCEIEFFWSPTVTQGKVYCCSGCAAGGPCCCDYSQYNAVNVSGVILYGPGTKGSH